MTGTKTKSISKKGRVIIRNLSFKVTEDVLKETFSNFGEITEIVIPKKSDGKMFGFGFIQFVKTASAIKAINALNAKEILGRPVAIDFAIPKNKFNELKTQSSPSKQKETKDSDESESSSESEKEEKNFDRKRRHSKSNSRLHNNGKKLSLGSNSESDSEDSDDSDSEKSDDEPLEKVKRSNSTTDNESGDYSDEGGGDDQLKRSANSSAELNDSNKVPSSKKKMTKLTSDVSEGRTVFIRNLSFDTTAEELKETISKYGDIKYCLLCKDPLTEYPKGTAFVQFLNKEDAEKCLKESNKDRIVLGDRMLNIVLALSHDDIKKQRVARMKTGKDNRNLKLLTEGLIKPGSEAAQGVSQADITKRLELEKYKKKLLKNLNYFISPVRLCVHNIPLHFDNSKLRKIFVKAAGSGAVVTECRIMRNMKKLDEKGIGLSKGFGFICFMKHEHALQALRKLNNNPDAFSSHKRPIVEFSVENRSILNAKKQQMERLKKKSFQMKKPGNFQYADNTKIEESKQKFFSNRKKKFSKPFKSSKFGKQQSDTVKKLKRAKGTYRNDGKKQKKFKGDGKKQKKLKVKKSL